MVNTTYPAGAGIGPVLDSGCLAELRALDPGGRAQLVKRVLATYQTTLVRHVEQLREARGDAAWDSVLRVAHTLKSSSASIGALALASLCADIERLLRGGDRDTVTTFLDRFEAEVARVEVAVRDELAACEAIGS